MEKSTNAPKRSISVTKMFQHIKKLSSNLKQVLGKVTMYKRDGDLCNFSQETVHRKQLYSTPQCHESITREMKGRSTQSLPSLRGVATFLSSFLAGVVLLEALPGGFPVIERLTVVVLPAGVVFVGPPVLALKDENCVNRAGKEIDAIVQVKSKANRHKKKLGQSNHHKDNAS